jgi:hypothetical protein
MQRNKREGKKKRHRDPSGRCSPDRARVKNRNSSQLREHQEHRYPQIPRYRLHLATVRDSFCRGSDLVTHFPSESLIARYRSPSITVARLRPQRKWLYAEKVAADVSRQGGNPPHAERTRGINRAVNTSFDASGSRHTICCMSIRSACLVAPSLRSAGRCPQ